jgi:uncharacterized protein (DUF302 family)
MKRLTFLALLATLSFAAQAADPNPVVVYSAKGKFDDAREFLKIAIENRGLVIDSTSYVNKMLERTGKDLGTTKKIYVDGQAFSFCSAVVSRKTMEADPLNIVFCPYSIAVYESLKEPGKVFVAYRRPWRPDGSEASKASLREVEKLLDGIAREALNIK